MGKQFFKKKGPLVKSYLTFANQYDATVDKIEELMKRERFAALIKDCEKDNSYYSLASYFLKVVQVVSLLEEKVQKLILETLEDYEDASALSDALIALLEVVEESNNMKTVCPLISQLLSFISTKKTFLQVAENSKKIKQIESKISGKNLLLNVPGRNFIKEGNISYLSVKKPGHESNPEVKKVASKEVFTTKWVQKDVLYFYLFSDILVMTKEIPSKKKFELKNVFALKNFQLESVNDMFGEFGIQFVPKSKTKATNLKISSEKFYLKSQDEFDCWFSELKKLMQSSKVVEFSTGK